MENEKGLELVPIGSRAGWTRYGVAPAGVVDIAESGSPASKYEESHNIVDDFDEEVNTIPFQIGRDIYHYVPYGNGDQVPFEVMKRVGENMVASQCQLFNV